MSKPEYLPPGARNSGDDEPKGTNLVLIYSLIALALATAIGFALLIVFPFYRRR